MKIKRENIYEWFRLLYRVYYDNKWLISCTGLLWGISILAQVISPLIGKRIFDEALPSNNQRSVILLGVIWIGISWLSSTLNYFCDIFVTKVDTTAIKNTKLMVLRAFLNEFSRGENTTRKHGDRLSRILNDHQVFISSSGVGVLLTTVMAAVTFIVVLSLSIYLDWPLAIMCLVGTGASVILQYRTPQILAKHNQEVATVRAYITSLVENIIRAWRTIIRYKTIETEIDTAEKGLNKLVITTRTALGKMYSAQLNSELLIKTMPILLIWIAAYRMSSGKMSLGTLIAFFSYLWMMSSSLGSILTSSFKAFSGFGQARDFMEIINNSIKQADFIDELPDKSSLSTIVFEDIKLVAGDFSLRGEYIKFAKGKTYLLTGDSGVGKSIFLEFLAGIRKAEHVRILKNDKTYDDESFTIEARQFGYLYKEEILFDRSVLENMTYGTN
jgi:ABC-type bacteriocin/lantibiotic exporter with double-glycine peptidase domain